MPIYRAPHLAPECRIRAVRQFLSTFSQDKRVAFDFDQTPKTDGKTVWLGALDPNDEAFEVLAVGHGIHEMLHVTETDMDALPATADSLLHALVNVLEDVRIDGIGSRRYPGYLAYRRELIEMLEQRGRLRYDADPKRLTSNEILACWLHTTLLVDIGCDWAQTHADKFRVRLKELSCVPNLSALCKTASQVHAADSTQRVVAIARELLALWPVGEHAETTPAQDACRSLAQGTPLRLPMLLTQYCETQRRQNGVASAGYAEGDSDGIESMPWPLSVTDRYQREDQKRYATLFDAQISRIGELSESFRHALSRPVDDETQPANEGIALSPTFLNALACGSNKLFAAVPETIAPLADVCILLDRSGSMGTDRMTLAKVAVAALSRALHALEGVQTHTAVFPGLNRIPIGLIESPETPTELAMQRLRTVNAYGGTPLAAALQWSVNSFSERDAKRLIVMITDGVFPHDRIGAFESLLRDNDIELALLCIDTHIDGLTQTVESVSEAQAIVPALQRLIARTRLARSL